MGEGVGEEDRLVMGSGGRKGGREEVNLLYKCGAEEEQK